MPFLVDPGVTVGLGQPAKVRIIPTPSRPVRLIPVSGPPGPPGADSGGVTITAAAGLTTGTVVALTPAGAMPADPTNPGHAWAAAAVTTSSAVMGETLTAITTGRVTEQAWTWAPNAPVYCGAGGQLTQTSPTSGWLRIIGHAENPTTIFVQIHQPITLI
jgi:hypothetical protein